MNLFHNLNSNNFENSKKNSFLFMILNSNYKPNNSNTIQMHNFNNIKNVININNFKIKTDIKENEKIPDLIEKDVVFNEPNQNHSNKTKNS